MKIQNNDKNNAYNALQTGKKRKVKKIVKLRKQGNCLVITIPRDLLDDLKWMKNDQILIESLQNSDSILKGPRCLKAGKID